MAKRAIFKMVATAILNFKNFNFWSRNCNLVHHLLRDCHRVQYLIQCTKFHQNRTIFHGDMAILRFSKWRPSAILDFKKCSFCHVALLDMPFCFLIRNFAEIGQSGSPFALVCRISSKSDNFSLRYGDLTISKMAAVRHLVC